VIITLPFTVRAALAGLVGVRRSLVEAAMSLGATEGRAMLDVVVPLARTGMVSGALFAFALSFDEVAVSIFLSDPFTTTLPVALVAEMRANLNLTIAAVSTLFVVLTVALILVLDWLVGLDRVIGYGIYRS
jgi:putative spermidine/putrescine transport system permease protein